MVDPNLTKPCNIPTPVSVKLCGNSSPVEQLAAGSSHPLMGGLSCVRSKGSRGISHDEDVVSLLDQCQGGEGNADFGQNATFDMLDLLPHVREE